MNVRIFLASPGDVTAEREAAERVVREVSTTVGPARGVTLEAVRWETHAHPGFGADAQDVINGQIAEMKAFHLFVGIVWNRLGTPTARSESGTAEEFERAEAAFKQFGRPDIWFYFGAAPTNLKSKAEVEQRMKVIDFRERVEAGGLVKEYPSADAFADVFRRDLTLWVNGKTFDAPQGALSGFAPAARPVKSWTPAVLYPLQPAPHFAGRQALLAELTTWAADPAPADRVVSLVAPGGTGKTALAERALTAAAGRTDRGLFVWSFYENDKTEAFLRAACEYFTGEPAGDPGSLLGRLQKALTDGVAHLLVLDGLERVQADGYDGRPRGGLDDPQVRRLLRWLADGRVTGTAARALVTSRFPLADLTDWAGRGYAEHRLDDLDHEAARSVFRGWSVRGDDAALDGLTESVHGHALTVAVLASYLKEFGGGDPANAPSFDAHDLAGDDPKAAKLARVLDGYAARLTPPERDLLARLAAFPRGVTVGLLESLVAAGGDIAGALTGHVGPKLQRLAKRLQGLGLVFRYDTAAGPAFTAHPFLRGHFATLLTGGAEDIHRTVRRHLADGLDEKPKTHPSDPALLDRYEALIEHTLLAGDVERAIDLYWYSIGGYGNLGRVVGDYTRGLRMVTTLVDGNLDRLAAVADAGDRMVLATEWGLYATPLGDLVTGYRCFEIARIAAVQQNNPQGHVTALTYLIIVSLLAGRGPAAVSYARDPRTKNKGNSWKKSIGIAPLVYEAAAAAFLGEIESAHEFFDWALKQHGSSITSIPGLRCVEWLTWTGALQQAIDVAHNIRHWALRHSQWRDVAFADAGIAKLLATQPINALKHLTAARAFADRSGNVEIQLPAHLAAAEIARQAGDHSEAVRECRGGIHLADSCGFGRYSIDLRVELAKVHLVSGDPQAALTPAAEALTRAEHPDCQYAWGIADALHLLGVAHARLGHSADARGFLTRAVEKRTALTHPDLADTRRELDALDI